MAKAKQNRDQPKADPVRKDSPPSQADQDVRRGDSNRDTDIDIDVDPEEFDLSDRTPSGEEAGDED